MTCDCARWLTLPPGAHHDHCTARSRRFEGRWSASDCAIACVLAASAVTAILLGALVVGLWIA